jgi:hypothetical protein
MAAELLDEWVALQPPVIFGKPTPEQQGELGAIAAKKKEWLKQVSEKLGKSEKALVKELTKLAKKAAPKTESKPKAPKPKKESGGGAPKKDEAEDARTALKSWVGLYPHHLSQSPASPPRAIAHPIHRP